MEKEKDMTFLTDSIMSSNLISIEENQNVEMAEAIMNVNRIRHLPVVDELNELSGIISATDIANTQDKKVSIRSVMSQRVRIIKQNSNIKKIIEQMLRFKISSMLVAQDDELVGIVTTDDLLQLLYELLDEDEHVQASEVPNLIENVWIDGDDDHVLQRVVSGT